MLLLQIASILSVTKLMKGKLRNFDNPNTVAGLYEVLQPNYVQNLGGKMSMCFGSCLLIVECL